MSSSIEQQPVVVGYRGHPPRPLDRLPGPLGEHAVEVLELAEISRARRSAARPRGASAAARCGSPVPARDARGARHRARAPSAGAGAARGEVQAQAPAAGELPGVHRLVAHRRDGSHRRPRQCRSRRTGSRPVGSASPACDPLAELRRRARLRRPRTSGCPCRLSRRRPALCATDHQAGGAAAAEHMAEAAAEREQLASTRRRLAAPAVEAPAGASPRVGGARERAQLRVGAGAAVLERGAGHVEHPRVRRVRRAGGPATPARRRRARARPRTGRRAAARSGGSSCWRPTRSACPCLARPAPGR